MAKNKPAASFQANAAKKATPAEQAVEQLLAVWDSPQRSQLFWDAGFNCNAEMTEESLKQVNETRERQEAIRVDMDKSADTRFALGIFTANRSDGEPVYLYTLAHRGKAVVTGPEDISEALKAKLGAAGITYAAQSDKAAATSKIDDFMARGFSQNMRDGNGYFDRFQTAEILILAFSACEEISDKVCRKEPDGSMTVLRGTTIGTVLAHAGNDPASVMYTVDLAKPGVRQENKMNWETEPEAPQAKAAPVAQVQAKTPRPGGS